MAKITKKGLWIEISSLNPEDKKNYIRSGIFILLSSSLLGIHLAHIGFLGDEALREPIISEPWLMAVRILTIVGFFIGAYFYKLFFETQDDLFKGYHNAGLLGGSYGFLIFGLLLTVLSPYFNYSPNFYEFFIAFAAGSAGGGYYFYKKYLA